MRRILVAIDPTEQGRSSVLHLLAAPERAGDLSVVLLSTQPAPIEWQTRGLFRKEIRDRLIAYGRDVCASAAARLAAAGVSHRVRVELDDPAAAILRCAREERCTEILIGAPRPGRLARALVRMTRCLPGSVAAEVVHLSDVPVTVVH